MNRDETYMRAALTEARRALDAGEFPVGCIIGHESGLLSRGRRANSRGAAANELDHAEIAALRRLLNDHPGIAPGEVTVYATMEPCLMCYSTLLLNGIRRIVYAYEDAMGGGTDLDLAGLKPLYRRMQVEIVPNVCRAESLELFRQFFLNPDNGYWQDSLLAAYTSRQS
jgi:tRNA(adenine34) deaminase